MITAIILAAGESKRMGRPKMLLPWGKTTVLGQVIVVLKNAGIEDILVVCGGDREGVEATAKAHQVGRIFNPDYANGEMLRSLQIALAALDAKTSAALVCLGDQPQIQEKSVHAVLQEYARSSASLIVPSYQRRRGHPWLATRALWDELLSMKPPQSPRDFSNVHAAEIKYIDVETPSVIEDLDTPKDYQKYTHKA